MMNNNKSRYQAPNPMYNRPFQPQGVPPPGGVAGSAPPRNALGPQNMRVQNGPPRLGQPQQQQQPPHQLQHGQMSGPSSQHPHAHATSAPQQGQQPQQHPQQQQLQQQQQQLAFTSGYNPNPQYFIPTAAYQYAQINPHGPPTLIINQPGGPRYITTSTPHQNVQLFYPPQQIFQTAAHPQNQQTMIQHHQQHQAATQQLSYYPYHMTQNRLPVHQAALNTPVPVQVPPVHQTTGGHVQQTSQHHPNIPHVPQQPTTNNTAQMVNRTEGAPVGATLERKRKILNIVDPTTGLNVIGDSNANSSSTIESSQGNASSTIEGNGDVVVPPAHPRESQTPPEVSAQGPIVIEEPVKVEKVISVTAEDPVQDESKSKARAEFFQKITQASDEGGSTGRSASVPGAPQGAVVDPPSPTPAAQAPEQPDSPPIDSSKSQQAVATPAANTSSDDSKDTSLVSVSPIPIEAYLTPRKTLSPPGGQVDETSFEDENADSTQEDESLSTTKDEVVSPCQEEVPLIDSETSTVDIEIENSCPESFTKDGVEDEVLSVNDKSESPTNEAPSEEQASIAHQNGDLELEEGEIPDADDEEEAETGAEATGTTESETSEQPKGKIKYDRDFLMNVGKQIKETKPTVPGGILPDVAKDANSMRSQNMSKSPSGPSRGEQFGSMGRRAPGQGPKPGLGGMMGGMGMNMNYPNRGNVGMMGWQPMMVPPRAPPPKVIELTREEVKLHKAENAWKPGSIKHKTPASEDPEEAITDDIVKKTRGILNKLTPENFAKLVTKFMNLPLEDKEERISKVIKVVFEKAVDEPSFSKEYAKMVHTVCNQSQETSRKFRKQILDQCQQEFQNNSTDETKIKDAEIQLEQAEEDKKPLLKAELDDLKFQSRRRSLGNIRFIGELYKLQMLTPKIMVECVGMLLSSTDEENLECLCKLLTTVGQKLEEQLNEIVQRVNMVRNWKSKDEAPKLPKFIPDENWMTKTFNSLRNLSDNKNLSSRIRFALLDVVELRDNYWKPRRDANAPKTIDEVRQDAIRQEMEEKRQISNLPPPSLDQRGSSRTGPPQAKKGDWNVQNKSSRFQVKSSKDSPSTLPLLAPPMSTWGRSSGGGGMQSNKPPPNVAPRFNRYNSLADDRDRDGRDRLNSNQHPSANSRDSMPPQQQQPYAAPYASPRRVSPAPSSTSSRENSRPVSPKEINLGMNNQCTADVNETVKNIFEEYCSVGNTADALDWIKQRFPGDKVTDFLDELSRQVGEMSKLTQQQKAGSLVRSLIKSNEISLTKDTVLSTLSQGVIADLPDIMIDVPMVSNYLAQFLVEIFHDDSNLDWLLTLDEELKNCEDYESSWNDFCSQSLTVLRSKTNEDVVRTLYTSTKDNSRIPLQDLPWISPDPESIAQQMIPVLKGVNNTDENEIRQALKENSWDLREELISHSLIEAICIISWTPELRQWDEKTLKKFIPVLPENSKLFPSLWKRVCEFISRNGVDSTQKDKLWDLLYMFDRATALPEDQEQ